jgi:hypothetical protein
MVADSTSARQQRLTEPIADRKASTGRTGPDSVYFSGGSLLILRVHHDRSKRG